MHPNVLPLLGVSELFPFCIINPWLQNGNIVQYIKKNREVDRLQLVGVITGINETGQSNLTLDSSHKPPLASNICTHWASSTITLLP